MYFGLWSFLFSSYVLHKIDILTFDFNLKMLFMQEVSLMELLMTSCFRDAWRHYGSTLF